MHNGLQLPETLRAEFALRAEWRKEDEHTRERNYIDAAKRKKDEIEHEKREEKEDREVIEAVLATTPQMAAFKVQLDRYDTATVEALTENRKALELIEDRLTEMRKEAYLLPDGRKAFKTQDGKQVFDESGAEIKDFDADRIDDRKPRWEAYRDGLEARKALSDEQDQLHDYQHELDEARDRTHDKGLTKKEIDDLGRVLS